MLESVNVPPNVLALLFSLSVFGGLSSGSLWTLFCPYSFRKYLETYIFLLCDVISQRLIWVVTPHGSGRGNFGTRHTLQSSLWANAEAALPGLWPDINPSLAFLPSLFCSLQFPYHSPLECACVLSCFSRVPLFAIPMDCSPSGSSVQGILQTRILEWAAMPSSRGSSRPRDRTHIS